MARTKKDRSEEVEAVFNGLKYCNTEQLKQIIDKANKLIADVKQAEIETLEAEIKKMQAKVADLKK